MGRLARSGQRFALRPDATASLRDAAGRPRHSVAAGRREIVIHAPSMPLSSEATRLTVPMQKPTSAPIGTTRLRSS